MKGIIMTMLFACLSIGMLQAQKTKVKTKNLVNAADYCLARVDTLLDGVVQNQTFELSGLNLKYPSDLDFKVFYKGTAEDLKLYLDSAIQFVELNTQGATSLYQKTQFAIPTSSSNYSSLLVVFSYDTYHMFKIAQLKLMKEALAKSLMVK